MRQHDLTGRPDLSHISGLADRVTARCGACGCNWELLRHEALMCPMCCATFTYAYMSPVSPTYVDLEAIGGATAW
jgi:hypothetical protein